MSLLFHKFLKNTFGCFLWPNIVWHGLAILLTFFLVVSGADWLYYLKTRSISLATIIFPAVILGGLLPIFGPLGLLFYGKINKNLKIINTAWALGQAGLIGLIISDLYKAFTGRAHPEFGVIITDITREFHFGFLQKGVFWGWPSSHTAVAFAIAIALITLYPKNRWLKYAALAYAFYIGLGVSVSIHWFSDFAAGAIIGMVIGKVVGKSFSERLTSFTNSAKWSPTGKPMVPKCLLAFAPRLSRGFGGVIPALVLLRHPPKQQSIV